MCVPPGRNVFDEITTLFPLIVGGAAAVGPVPGLGFKDETAGRPTTVEAGETVERGCKAGDAADGVCTAAALLPALPSTRSLAETPGAIGSRGKEVTVGSGVKRPGRGAPTAEAMEGTQETRGAEGWGDAAAASTNEEARCFVLTVWMARAQLVRGGVSWTPATGRSAGPQIPGAAATVATRGKFKALVSALTGLLSPGLITCLLPGSSCSRGTAGVDAAVVVGAALVGCAGSVKQV